MKILFLVLVFLGSGVAANNIDLSADGGFVWDQRAMTVLVRDNAVAKTEEYAVTADEMKARYREVGRQRQFHEIVATGSVVVTSDAQVVKTGRLDYDMDKEVVTLRGMGPPTYMKTETAEMWAQGEVVYYRNKNYATANMATLKEQGRTMRADDVRMDMLPEGGLKRVFATGNIRVVDGEEELFGDNADYDPETGLVMVTGNVRFKRGLDASVQGDRIIYDMRTGIAKILPRENERVEGTFKTASPIGSKK